MAGTGGRIDLKAVLGEANAPIGGGQAGASVTMENTVSFMPGNGALGLADAFYHADRIIAASGTENLDLTGLLLDPLGNVVTEAEIMAVIIKAKATNTNDVVFGPAAANGFLGAFNAAADRLHVQPGEMVVLTSVKGWPVTAATGDLLTVLNGGAGTGVEYEIAVVGRSVVG